MNSTLHCLAALSLLGLVASHSAAHAQEPLPSESVARTSDHFPITNEARQDLWFATIAGRGGAYVGVGADQNYTLAAVQEAELAFVLDYDPIVTRLHRAVLFAVRRCPDGRCVLDSFDPSAEAELADALASSLDESWESRRTVRALLVHRAFLREHFEQVHADPASWLGHPERYRHVRSMALEGRILVATGDLTGATTMRAIATRAQRAAVPLRVLYLSNAEEYFSYTPRFVANLAALEADDAVVLRTLRDHRLARPRGDGGWHYQTQPLDEFQARLAAGYADSSWIVVDTLRAPGVRRGRAPVEQGLSDLAGLAPARRAGAVRWWLNERAGPAHRPGPRRPSRLLVTARRALSAGISGAERRRLAAIDLEGTALSRLGRARLPARSGRVAIELSGQPAPGAAEVDVAEESVHALLFDGVVRRLVAPLFETAGEADVAHSLREAPVAADLYAAYRLRDRLLAACPGRDRAPHRRACRAAATIIRPARTRRGRPSWSERRGRLASALRRVVSLGGDETEAVDLLADLARTSRATEAVRAE